MALDALEGRLRQFTGDTTCVRRASAHGCATYKIPRYWKLVEAFPLTVTGQGAEVPHARDPAEERKFSRDAESAERSAGPTVS